MLFLQIFSSCTTNQIVAKGEKIEYTFIIMEENINNITNPDISGLFSTYKTSPTGNEKNAPEDSTVSTINNPVLPKIYQDNILSIKK